MFADRPYQQEGLTAIAREHKDVRSVLLVMATGTGKTRLFVDYAKRFRRTLIIAHRNELLDQATRAIKEAGLTVHREQAEYHARRTPDLFGRSSNIVVASVQTLGKASSNGQESRLERWPKDAFDLVVVDEAHRTYAKTYGVILKHFEEAKLLGVTATPDRGDKKALGKIYETVAYRYEIQQAIEDGYLSPLKAKAIMVEELVLDGIKVTAGDFQQGDLGVAMSNEVVLQRIAKPLLEMSGDRSTIAFGPTVAWCHDLADLLNDMQPGVALALDGKIPVDERRFAMRDSEHRILINCQLFTEGYDDPELACVAICRPTKSRSAYTQMVGRGTRPCPHCPVPIYEPCEHKPDMLLLDFSGVSKRHSLVGPADVLAGCDSDPRVKKKVKKLLRESEGGMDLEEAVAVAKKWAREVKIRTRAEVVNPFRGGGPMPERSPYSTAPSDAQKNCLTKFGVSYRHLERMDKKAASQMISACIKRREEGLCTFKQAALVQKWGHDPVGMSFDEASAIIDAKINGRSA